MPAVIRIGDMSAGHGCFPPTALAVTPVNKTFFNGRKPGVLSPACQHVEHRCGRVVHPNATRTPSSGAAKTFIEGFPAARIGDSIVCGDTCSGGSPNSFIE
jgi:uncharacterized Zn-binding protein involved in type VI secretion